MTSFARLLAVTRLRTGMFLLAGASAFGADAPPAGEPPARSGVELQAEGAFFDGQIGVRVRLGTGPGRGPDGASRPAGAPPRDAARPRGRRGPPGGGGPGGMPPGGGPGGPAGGSDEGPAIAGGRIRAGGGRPLMLHLAVTNRGGQPAAVEVADFNSALGNFVVLPSRFKLDPGASAEAEPMTSRLGHAAAEVPVTVRLKLAGRSEQQVLTLRVAPLPAAVPPPSPPTAPAEVPPDPGQPPKS